MMTDSLDGSGPWPTWKKRPRLLGAGRKQAAGVQTSAQRPWPPSRGGVILRA